LLAVGDDLVVLEVKAGFISEEAKGARDPAVIDSALRKKYVTDARNRRVGVRQLAGTCTALVDGGVPGITVTGRVYPVLLGEDPILQTPGINIYFDDLFREEVTSDRIMPLTVMLVDELEQLLPHVKAGDITWQDVFTTRSSGARVAGGPVHTTFVDLAVARGLRRRPDTFLAKHSERLIAMIRDAYRDLT
jgi:hypothetical protein